MSEQDLQRLLEQRAAGPVRRAVARAVESPRAQAAITGVILVNAVVMGLQTSGGVRAAAGAGLALVDAACLAVFVGELALKLFAYRWHYFRNGWNVFDFLVVAVAFVPGSGPFAVLRSLRVLRILRLFTMVPQLRRVVAAFLHAIPGLLGVLAVMLVFFYTSAVLATGLFGAAYPQWFGTLGESLFTLFQIMTLESWSMGIVRPLLETHPWAWLFFVPFIVIATFTILNLFIGIIVSTMQELAVDRQRDPDAEAVGAILGRLERDLAELRRRCRDG